jgi:hypothetical protein
VDHKDVTLEEWQILKACEVVQRSNIRMTIRLLADLVRGAGNGAPSVPGAKKRGRPRKKEVNEDNEPSGSFSSKKRWQEIDVNAICGKVNLSGDVGGFFRTR